VTNIVANLHTRVLDVRFLKIKFKYEMCDMVASACTVLQPYFYFLTTVMKEVIALLYKI